MLVRKRLIAAALPLALACLAPGPAIAEDRDASSQPSDALFVETRCGFCHSTAPLIVLAQRKLSEDGPEEVKAFLVGHHAPDDEAREAIFRFLLNAPDATN